MRLKKFINYSLLLTIGLITVLLLTACGGGKTSDNSSVSSSLPTVAPTPTLKATVTAVSSRGNVPPTKPVIKQATPTVSNGLDLAAKLSEHDIVRTFTDAQGRTIKLVYGRGEGHRGDYGWAHIRGKHVEHVWFDGGIVTTYPQAFGTKSLDEVVNLVNKSLQDKNPDNTGNGRRAYVYAVPNTKFDVFTVVGNDGTIITAYPVEHGTKGDG